MSKRGMLWLPWMPGHFSSPNFTRMNVEWSQFELVERLPFYVDIWLSRQPLEMFEISS